MRIINTYREPVGPEQQLSEAEILARCCAQVPVNPCSEVGRVSVYEGADAEHRDFDEQEALRAARSANPNIRILGVRTEGIGPPPGTPCGTLRESWEGRNNCCEDAVPLAWDMNVTPDVLPHNSSIIIAWTGGTGGETTVTTSSNATYFDDGRKSITGYGSSVRLLSGETFCGATSVTVSDGCTEATVLIRSDNGQWTAVSPFCAVSGVTATVTGRSGNIIYGQGIGGAYKFLETVEATYINLPQILSTECEEPNCPPYTQCCAKCYGELHCPSALEAIAHEPAPCMRYERDQSFVSWLQYNETDGIDDPWVNKLMKHCDDRSSAVFVGTLVSNYCYNNQHRLAYLKQTALQTFQWTC